MKQKSKNVNFSVDELLKNISDIYELPLEIIEELKSAIQNERDKEIIQKVYGNINSEL